MASLSKAPRTSISPFVIAGAAYLTQAALKASFLKPHLQMDSLFQPGSLFSGLFDLERSSGQSTEASDSANLEVFVDYLIFIILSIIFNLLIMLFDRARTSLSRQPHHSTKESPNYNKSESLQVSTEHHHYLSHHNLMSFTKSLIKAILCYTVAFCFIKTALLLLTFSLSKDIPLQPNLPRILQQEQDQNNTTPAIFDNKTPEKVSLAVGRVLSSLDIEPTIIVMTKDEKYTFVSTDNPQFVRVYDTSDFSKPVQVAAVSLEGTWRNRMFLELSADETILVASSYADVKIINVTNPRSPKLIGTYSDPMYYSNEGMIFTSMAISPDNKYLYMAEVGFAILDISNSSKIKMLYSSVKRGTSGSGNLVSLSASADRKTLYLANGKGTLEVYNVTNASQPALINKIAFNDSTTSSVFLSKYDSLAYVVGTAGPKKMAVNVIDISNPLSHKEVSKFIVATTFSSTPIIQQLSPRETKLYVVQQRLMTIDLISMSVESNSENLVKNNLLSLCFSSSGQYAGVAYLEQLSFVQLFTDYPNTKIFTPSNSSLASFTMDRRFESWAVNNDGTVLFVAFNDYERLNSAFEIWNIKNKEVPKLISSLTAAQLNLNLTAPFLSFKMSPDNKRVYLKWWTKALSQITIMDVSKDLRFPTKLKEFTVALSLNFEDFAFSKDEKILCVTPKSTLAYLYKVDDPTQTAIRVPSVESYLTTGNFDINFIKNDKILLLITFKIDVYDLSDLSKVKYLGAASLTEGGSPRIISTTVLDEEDRLIVEWYQTSRKLRVYDLSNILKPKLVSELSLPKRNFDSTSDLLQEFYGPFVYLDSQKIGYVGTNGKLLRIDLSDLNNPVINGIVPVPTCVHCGNSRFIISPDGSTAFATNQTGMLQSLDITSGGFELSKGTDMGSLIFAVDLQIKSTLFIPQEKFLLGERFSDNVFILKNVGKERYQVTPKTQSKVLKLYSNEVKVISSEGAPQIINLPLPDWMKFNQETLFLTVECKSKKELGVYTICAAISNEVNKYALDKIGPANDTFKANELITTLISLGYMDRQFYLTTEFGTREGFFLPEKFADYKGQIYDILSKYYIEDCTKIQVVKSLAMDVINNKIVINTTSIEVLKVDITLIFDKDHQNAHFVSKNYGPLVPEIRDQKARIVLEGSLNEIHLALQNVVIDTPDGTAYDGLISITDSLNYPIVNQRISKISDCFLKNSPPFENPNATKTFQEQLDRVSVATGQYFTIMWDANTFVDHHSETLHYEVILDNDGTTGGPKAFPDWLTFSGLALRGTPPEKISGREISLKFIVKNEFQSTTIPFKLKIGISPTFVLSLLIKYSPMLLTALGFYIKANRIYNIVAKKRYKHAKEYQVQVGEEISSQSVFPILLIENELRESQAIVKHLLKHLKKGKVDHLVSHFVDDGSRILDKSKIIESINQTLSQLPSDEQKKFPIYLYGSDFNRKKVVQIIFNQIVMLQLNSPQEKQTHKIFEDIKEQWADLVQWDSELLFVIQKERLSEIFDKRNPSSQAQQDNQSLLGESVNQDLLQDALISYAFALQSVNARSTMVLIEVYERVTDGQGFKSFLKRDLEGSHLNSQTAIDYGVNCQFDDGMLVFSGTPKHKFKGRILAVQIQNTQFRILKEIWIQEKSAGAGNSHIELSSRRESSLRGNAYEVY